MSLLSSLLDTLLIYSPEHRNVLIPLHDPEKRKKSPIIHGIHYPVITHPFPCRYSAAACNGIDFGNFVGNEIVTIARTSYYVMYNFHKLHG